MNKLVRFCILALLVPLSGFSATKICDDSRANILDVNIDGAISARNQSSGIEISSGRVTGLSSVNKFGNAPDFDAADNSVTVWDGAEDGAAWENMVYDYSTTADIDSVSSSDVTDTNITVVIQGLDANTNLVSTTATLNGTNRVALSTNFYRVFRGYNNNGTPFSGHIVAYPNTALTAGVPTDKSKIRMVIQPENQQTEMSLYTIPSGKVGYLRAGYSATSGASKTSNYIVTFYSRTPGGVFRLQNRVSLSDTGTSYIFRKYDEPPAFPAGTDLEVRVQMTAAGGTAAAVSAGFDIILEDQ